MHFSFSTWKAPLHCLLALTRSLLPSWFLFFSIYCVPPYLYLLLRFLLIAVFNNLNIMCLGMIFSVFHLWFIELIFASLEYLSNLDIFQPVCIQIFFSVSSLLRFQLHMLNGLILSHKADGLFIFSLDFPPSVFHFRQASNAMSSEIMGTFSVLSKMLTVLSAIFILGITMRKIK